ncbi:hypothetical protein [Hasllibacter sp. MH4015]|uniref:hypothetical protein n=1 Tax=Hasllibacter sp. MH4015 TaxID=2854029 RepID=UPI001CD30AA5|nr:hypothetical protein [Hasllibacter sp. MH4015]
MSDYNQHRNQAFDYAPPSRSTGSGKGALLLVAGIFALFFLFVLFAGGGGQTPIPEEGAAPAVAPADDAPTAPAVPIAE